MDWWILYLSEDRIVRAECISAATDKQARGLFVLTNKFPIIAVFPA